MSKIRTDPRLPIPGDADYDRRLNFQLTEVLREIAKVFNSHRHYDFDDISSGVGTNTTLDDGTHTISVTTSGLTITLPPASADRVGKDWTVHLGVAGLVTIACSGSDTVFTALSATDTAVDITTLGDSLTFRCLTATSWIIV